MHLKFKLLPGTTVANVKAIIEAKQPEKPPLDELRFSPKVLDYDVSDPRCLMELADPTAHPLFLAKTRIVNREGGGPEQVGPLRC